MSSTNRILLAEDDRGVRNAVERALEYEGYEVVLAENGARALELAAEQTPDLYLLDVMMPFVDGLSVCRTLRQRGDTTPVLMLTARHEISDRVAGLDAGADDYLVKTICFRRTARQDTSSSSQVYSRYRRGSP